MKKYIVLGVMSGSSMDGVDMALCAFWQEKNSWVNKIIFAETIPYTQAEIEMLRKMPVLTASEFIEADRRMSIIYAQKILQFLSLQKNKPELISFHGHTIFHNPSAGYTYQAGHGGVIASLTGIPVVSDFRSQDIVLGGEGAPLVPLGDEVFYSEYEAVLNLGGIANVSFKDGNNRKGFDIVPVNQILNYLAELKGLPFDDGGNLAKNGNLIPELFQEIINIKHSEGKSLGREFVEIHWIPVVKKYLKLFSINDVIHTTTAAITEILARILSKHQKILITGGGAYNTFLIELLRKKLPHARIFIPEDDIIQFKEALIFAFLGLLRLIQKENTLPTVTHSRRPSVSGALWMP